MKSSGRWVSGYAIQWLSSSSEIYDKDTDSYFKEIFLADSLVDTLKNRDQYLLYAHDPDKKICRIGQEEFHMVSDEKGLYFSVRLPNTPLCNRILREIEIGYIRSMSIGFNEIKHEKIKIGSGDYRVVSKAALKEISFVHRPAYTDTSVTINRTVEEELLSKIKIALDRK